MPHLIELNIGHSLVSRAVFTRIEEADLKPAIDRVVAAHPRVDVGSYPKWFDKTTKSAALLA